MTVESCTHSCNDGCGRTCSKALSLMLSVLMSCTLLLSIPDTMWSFILSTTHTLHRLQGAR